MVQPVSRRRFLRTVGATVAAALAPKAVPAGKQEGAKNRMLPIVDTHQHLWDLNQFRLPWIKPDMPLARNFLRSDYLQATAGLNVARAIYMEVDVAPEQQVAEAEFILDLIKHGGEVPTVAAVISGRPASESFKAYISRYKNRAEIKGVRQVLHNDAAPPGTCLGKQFIQSIQFLGEIGKSFDLCMRPGELLDAAKLIDACPGTRFILDHCGNANVQARDRSQWERDIAAVARRKQVVCKVSGILASVKPGAWTAEDLAPIINHVLDVFGPDRVMFGGDWPVCLLGGTYRQWVEALRNIVANRPEADQRKLFSENAIRFYNI